MNKNYIKSKRRAFWGCLALSGCLLAQPAFAQNDLIDDEDEENVYELSPFVVETDENVGYLATSTLAGTRLKTELKDVGSAISVVTPEFLEDTGATDAESLLVYTTSTEIGGATGNFAGSAVAAGDEGANSTARANPQSNNRVRGLSHAQSTRDYFLTAMSFDGYNTEGVTISRGPNSILFGIGEPGGIIENSLKKAIFGKDLTKTSLRFGNRHEYRVTLDFNREVIEDRLALRFNSMKERINFQQDPTYEEDTRWMLSGTWRVFKNEDRDWMGPTTIRANFEKVEIRGTPPNTMPPADLYSTWWDGPGNEVADAMVGVTQYGADYDANYASQWVWDNLGVSTTPGNKFAGQPGIWNSYTIVYDDASTGLPGLNAGPQNVQVIDGATGRFQYGTDPVTGEALFTPGWFPLRSTNNGPWRAHPGFKNVTIQDSNVIDWENVFLPGRAQFANHDFEAYNVMLEQNFFDNTLGFQFAFDKQTKDLNTHFPLGRAIYHSIFIDTAVTLTNAEPNPNVGRPMIAGMWDPENFSTEKRETKRLTAYYTKDFTENENWTSWLGSHTVTGLYNQYETHSESYAMRMSWDDSHDPEQRFRENQNRVGSWGGAMFFMAYVGDSQFDAASPSDLRLYDKPLNLVKPQVGDEYTNYYYDKVTGTLNYSTVKVQEFLQWPGGSHQEIDSQAWTLQSKFLDDHIIYTFGWRKDRAQTWQITNGTQFRDPDTWAYMWEVFDQGWLQEDGSVGTLGDADPTLDQTGETKTQQLVAHVPDSWMKWGGDIVSSLSFHYAESENFNPAAVRRDIYNDVIGSPSGETTEYGLTVGLLEGRASVRLNWYETTSQNVTNRNYQGQMWGTDRYMDAARNWMNQKNRSFDPDGLQWEDYAWVGENGTGPDEEGAQYRPERLGNFNSFDEIINAILGSMPTEAADGHAWEIIGEEGNQEVVLRTPQNLSTVADLISEGFEIEAVLNVTSNWRIAFNASKAESTFGNSLQSLSTYFDQAIANLQSAGLWGEVTESGNFNAPTIQQRFETDALIPYYAALAKDNTVSTELRKWRWNFVTNYQFNEGVLDGFGVGGAVRWQDSVSTGYPLIRDEFNNLIPELENPYTGSSRWNGDFWFSYKTKIAGYPVRFQLNCQNYLGDDDPIEVTHNPDGQLAIVRSAPEKRWFLTTTVDF